MISSAPLLLLLFFSPKRNTRFVVQAGRVVSGFSMTEGRKQLGVLEAASMGRGSEGVMEEH